MGHALTRRASNSQAQPLLTCVPLRLSQISCALYSHCEPSVLMQLQDMQLFDDVVDLELWI